MLNLEMMRYLIDKAFPNSMTKGIWAISTERLWNEDTRRFGMMLVLDETFFEPVSGFHPGWYCCAVSTDDTLRWSKQVNLYGHIAHKWTASYFPDRLAAKVWIGDPT